MPLSPESAKTLDQVKKTGKPCKFVLVSKGAAVLGVVAYRKGSDDTRIREAKEAGNGAVACGIVDYAGNLSFKLLRSDGYEAPPVKALALKEFLNDGTDLKAKPTIDIVDSLPTVELEGDGQQQPQPPSQPSPQTQTPPFQYRSADDWKQIIAAIQGATDPQARAQLFAQAVRDAATERDRLKQQLSSDPQSPQAQEAAGVLGKVAEILKRLQPPQTAPQMPPLPPTPRRMPPLPPVPQQPTPPRPKQPTPPSPARQKLTALVNERQAIARDVKQRVESARQAKGLYDPAQIATILQECETDPESDFGKVISPLDLNLMTKPKKGEPRLRQAPDGRVLDEMMKKLVSAKTAAAQYIKEHKDPAIGSLPSRVKKRRQYCERFIKEIDDQIKFIGDRNGDALNLCADYEKRIQAGQYVSPDLSAELQTLLTQPLLSDDTKSQIRQTIAGLTKSLQQQGYQELGRSPNLSKSEKVDLLEAYGCGSRPSGGTSDVKLLRDGNGDIVYAVKSAAKESEQALDSLGLPNGACAMREDVASTVFEKFQELTKIDLGFPKSELMQVNGQPSAVIDGIKGKMADKEGLADIRREIEKAEEVKANLIERNRPPEEIQAADDELNKLQQKLANARQDMEQLPDKVSAKSMSKVLASSILSAQWDMKWGNVIIEGNDARPIDAGAGFPTLKSIDEFLSGDRKSVWRPPALEPMVLYPEGHSKAGQDLPIANQPMDQELVDSLLKMNAQTLVDAAKERRDALQRDNPNLGGGKELLADLSLQIMQASIEGAQGILTQKNPITLKEFCTAWTAWFVNWAPGFYQANQPT